MSLSSFVGDDNKRHMLDMSNEALEPFGLQAFERVKTSQGTGAVAGVAHENVFVFLDKHNERQLVTAFTAEEVRRGDVQLLAPANGAGGADPSFDGAFVEHRLKRILWRGGTIVWIVMQGRDGPCPVLALANALALLGRISLDPQRGRPYIYSATLRSCILEYLRSPQAAAVPPRVYACSSESVGGSPTEEEEEIKRKLEEGYAKETDQGMQATLNTFGKEGADQSPSGTTVAAIPASFSTKRLTVTDVIQSPAMLAARREAFLSANPEARLQALYDGMNIDPIFSDPEAFVADDDVLLFAFAGVRVLHGWVIDAADTDPFARLCGLSYNDVSLLAASSKPGSPGILGSGTDCRNMDSTVVRLTGSSSSSSTAVATARYGHAKPEGALPSSVSAPLEEQGGEMVEAVANVIASPLAAEVVPDRDLIDLAGVFYDATNAAQMTMRGLEALAQTHTSEHKAGQRGSEEGVLLEGGEVAVLFWRRHFFTVVKLRGQLLVLCANENFADKSSVVFSVVCCPTEEGAFTDGDGEPPDWLLSAVEAVCGDEFTVEEIVAAKAAIEGNALGSGVEGLDLTTLKQEVIAYLRSMKTAAPRPLQAAAVPAASAASAARGSTSQATCNPEVVNEFLVMFPDLDRAAAVDILSVHNGDLRAAINAIL